MTPTSGDLLTRHAVPYLNREHHMAIPIAKDSARIIRKAFATVVMTAAIVGLLTLWRSGFTPRQCAAASHLKLRLRRNGSTVATADTTTISNAVLTALTVSGAGRSPKVSGLLVPLVSAPKVP